MNRTKNAISCSNRIINRKRKSAEESLEELGFENLTKPDHGIAIIGGVFRKPRE